MSCLDFVDERFEVGVASPGCEASNGPAAVFEDAISSDVLAAELAARVKVLVAIDLDVELDAAVEEGEIELVADDVELEGRTETAVGHGVEEEPLGLAVRAEVQEGGVGCPLAWNFVAKIGPERGERGHAEFADFGVAKNDEGSTGTADGDVDQVIVVFDPAGAAAVHFGGDYAGNHDCVAF